LGAIIVDADLCTDYGRYGFNFAGYLNLDAGYFQRLSKIINNEFDENPRTLIGHKALKTGIFYKNPLSQLTEIKCLKVDKWN